ncbi:pilus assembly protein CpaB [Selenomonas sp. GACV-9]|uniref:Flp pilus assembly protein CpaB n=1 Tax=Selenomonas sp. GACV-9 TaxID=3158782 RepID=UPI0008E8693E|nr:pilus assembly protein CpaB [Selenomonas ruminantium]
MFSKLMDVLNDLQPRQLLMLAGVTAVVMFLAVYLALSSMMAKDEGKTKVAPVKQMLTTQVVMAKEDIPSRAVIQESMLEMKEVPAEAIPRGAMMSLQDVVGQPAASTIYAGDVVTLSKLIVDKLKTGFVAEIPENCRAVSVGISEITGVAGFAKPGDYVDVILVEKGNQGATSRFLLRNVLLLGINQDTAQEKDSSKTDRPKAKPAIATLALAPDDMLQLISAAAVGEIYLALRPFHTNDTGNFLDTYTLRSVKGSEVVKAPAPAAAPVYAAPASVSAAPSAPAAPRVSAGYEIIQGDKVIAK